MKLTQESKNLITFVKKNIHIPKNPLTNESKNYLSTLLKKINHYDSIYWYNKLQEYIPPQKPQNFDGVIPQNIVSDILIKYTNVYAFHINLGKRNFYIYLHFDKDTAKDECVGYCHNCLYKIYLWLAIADHYAKNDNSLTLKIYIYFTNHKKLLPSKEIILNTSHVNSAYTYACREHTMISIFRQEEWFKVFIHETFHCMGLDFACMDTTTIDTMIYDIIPLKKTDIRSYEAYTEYWAEILNILFISYFTTKTKDNYDLMLEKIEKMFTYERAFSLFQLVKVLKHNNLDYKSIFSHDSISINKKQNYKEDTYVISYYLLKSILLFNVNDFLKWNKQHNKTIDFETTNENLHSFVDFIKEKYQTTKFMDYISLIENIESSQINASMRMSLYEI